MTNPKIAQQLLTPFDNEDGEGEPLEQTEIPHIAYQQVSKERIPTNTTTYQHPIHRWFNFIAGFSPEFVHECCNDIETKKDAILLDPFAGCATAPLVACQRGMRAIGFEAHPIFARIAKAKFPSNTSRQELDQIESSIHEGFYCPHSLDQLPPSPALFLSKLLPNDSLEMLLGARESFKRNHLYKSNLAFLVLSKIVDLCSHSQTDGVYKAPTSRKKSLSPVESCEVFIPILRADLSQNNDINYQERCLIFNNSSEDMSKVEDESVSIIVTSPPYLNNFDYAEMTRMLLYFWGIANSWGDITDKVRSRLIVNTTTALKGHREMQNNYRHAIPTVIQSELDTVVSLLREQQKVRAGKKEYDYLVYPYFSQMTSVLKECYRCMQKGASIHIMVADAALYGIHISTPQFLESILNSIGFRKSQCDLVRTRGHRWILAKRDGSKTGLGEYYIKAVK